MKELRGNEFYELSSPLCWTMVSIKGVIIRKSVEMNRIVTTAPLNSPFQISTKKLFSKQREVPMQRVTFKEKHPLKLKMLLPAII